METMTIPNDIPPTVAATATETATATKTATATAAAAVFLGPGEGEAVWFLANRMTVKATTRSTGGAFGLLETLLAPGFSPPLHVHHGEDESFYVLEGTVTMRCGERMFRAEAGAFVFLPRDVPHTFVVEGNAPARMLTLLTPGGGEGFFVDGGRPAEREGLPPAGPPDIEALKRVSALYKSDIIGPPMKPTGR
jgi:mannose-6-phosphate isomerase-like protein (cupin superfamily)